MGVDNLQRGTNQPFYNTLAHADDRPGEQTTYVAEDNIIQLPAKDFVEGALYLFQPAFDGQSSLGPRQIVRIAPGHINNLNGERTRCILQETGQVVMTSLECLQPSSGQITHGELGRYFVAFDSVSGRYIPNEELKLVYPED